MGQLFRIRRIVYRHTDLSDQTIGFQRFESSTHLVAAWLEKLIGAMEQKIAQARDAQMCDRCDDGVADLGLFVDAIGNRGKLRNNPPSCYTYVSESLYTVSMGDGRVKRVQLARGLRSSTLRPATLSRVDS